MHRAIPYVMTIVFAVVGAIFLMFPAGLFEFFNWLSGPLGMKPAPPVDRQFFLILAVSYMYAVTLLAWLMVRYPGDRIYPLLLTHCKTASSVLSFLLFIIHQPFLIYLANGLIDGAIALIVFVLYIRNPKFS